MRYMLQLMRSRGKVQQFSKACYFDNHLILNTHSNLVRNDPDPDQDEDAPIDQSQFKRSPIYIYLQNVKKMVGLFGEQFNVIPKNTPKELEKLAQSVRLALKNQGGWLIPDDPLATVTNMVRSGNSLPKPDPFYLSKVFIWDPKTLYGVDVYCPNCKSPARLKGWANHPRKVYGLHEPYYLLSRRYCCSTGNCLSKNSTQDSDSDREDQGGSDVFTSRDSKSSPKTFSFLASSDAILSQMPDHLQIAFPAVLSKRSGLDKKVLHEHRIGADCSQGPEALASKIREYYCQSYHSKFTQYMSLVYAILGRQKRLRQLPIGEKRILPTRDNIPIFSTFKDVTGYNGSSPSGNATESGHV